MEHLLVIPGRLHNLNDLISSERTNRHKGAKMKADDENIVSIAIRRCMGLTTIDRPVYMKYKWVEFNKRRDKDNISSYGRKIIQDALVKNGVLKNDGWGEIVGFSDRFEVDKDNPRIEVLIKEI